MSDLEYTAKKSDGRTWNKQSNKQTKTDLWNEAKDSVKMSKTLTAAQKGVKTFFAHHLQFNCFCIYKNSNTSITGHPATKASKSVIRLSGCFYIRMPRYPDYSISGCLDIRTPRYPDASISGRLYIRTPQYLDASISRRLDIRTTRYPDASISGHLDVRT